MCVRAWLVFGLAACAQGFPDDPLASLPPRPSTGAVSGISGSAGAAGMGAAGQAGRMPYTGESCRMGETAPCTCSPQGTPGTKTCRYDRESPTMGTFSECGACEEPAGMEDPGDVMSAGAGGSAGRAGQGAGGRAGSAAGTSGGGTSGMSGSSGSGGSSEGGSSRGCMPACNNTCFPVGILPCCNALGRCGCTWAPGAYCL